jgi:hypothetical protein
MTENSKMLRVGSHELAAAAFDPQSITTIVIDALRNVIGLALGGAMDDGRFDERTAMILAEGVQVAVGDQRFWVNVFKHGDERVKHLGAAAVIAAREECEAQAVRLAARMPDGSAVWKDGDLLAQGASHCAAYVGVMAPEKPYEILERLKKAESRCVQLERDLENQHERTANALTDRDKRWREAVNGLVMVESEMRSAIAVLARANDAELSAEGRQAKIWAAELTALLKGD